METYCVFPVENRVGEKQSCVIHATQGRSFQRLTVESQNILLPNGKQSFTMYGYF